MLNFALVEYYERQKQPDNTESVLRTLLEKSYEDILKVESKIPPSESTRKDEEVAMPGVAGDQAYQGANGISNLSQSQESTSTTGPSSPSDPTKKSNPFKNLLQLRIRELGQVWIVFLRFAWRSKGFQDMRNVFKEARTDEKRYPSRFLDWRVWDFAGKSLALFVSMEIDR